MTKSLVLQSITENSFHDHDIRSLINKFPEAESLLKDKFNEGQIEHIKWHTEIINQ